MQRERRDAEHLVLVQEALTALKTALSLVGGEGIGVTAVHDMYSSRNYAQPRLCKCLPFSRASYRLSCWVKSAKVFVVVVVVAMLPYNRGSRDHSLREVCLFQAEHTYLKVELLLNRNEYCTAFSI